jgi:putative heme-binding domain-containing protein
MALRMKPLVRNLPRILLLGHAFLAGIAFAAQVEFKKGERIALVGGSVAERMNLHGHFETFLHARLPDRQLVLRNFAWPADEVGRRQRPNDYTKLDDPLKVFSPDTFLCFFGFNESFAGPEGIARFREEYARYIDETAAKYGRDGKARFILVSPIAFEPPTDPLLPSGIRENENLRRYTEAVRRVAAEKNLPFIDLHTPTLALFTREPGLQFTVNGAHLNLAGDREIGRLLDAALASSPNPHRLAPSDFERLRETVNDKAWVHQQDYRMLNGWYVYGGRRTWDTETFPLEYAKIRRMTETRDQLAWEIAQGINERARPDDSQTGSLIVPKTRFGVPQQSYSEPKDLKYVGGEEAIGMMEIADGFAVKLFASEEMFPELAKPVQMNFDSRGRLWVACMPTYPQWKPGDDRPNDRILILEDTDGDGRADTCKVFYDRLHCPTGFEFVNGGVLVIDQPRMVFLRDTDGDDRADVVTHLYDGWASDDSHHTMGAFEWSPTGRLHGLEGVAMSTTLETPWGPFRNANTPGAYVIDPRTLQVSHFITPGYGNPWCYVFNFWGQGICGDGTTAQMHWDSPLSGSQKGQRRGLNAVFNNEGMRPALGSEFLYSRHLPDDVQGDFVYGCVINMNGVPRFGISDDGAGFTGKRKPNLLNSTDRNFRPGETQIGPDGAIWFLDWHNPLIGHMQYSQRDPNRDKVHGRIYRLYAKDRPLLKPVLQAGRSTGELLDQLKEYEPRTRYRARRELRDRPTGEVLSAISGWISALDSTDRWHDLHLLEALYVQAGHRAVDRSLLQRVLKAPSRDARAMAVHVLSEEWIRLGQPMDLLKPMAMDPDPRVRLETVRALSFVESREAADAAVSVATLPMDYWLEYTLQHTLVALEPHWKPAHQQGAFASGNPVGRGFAEAIAVGQPGLAVVRGQLQKLIETDALPEAERSRLLTAIGSAKGRVREGRSVFERVCTSCHKVQDFGINYGPELTEVAKRLSREKLVESILYPNLEVAPEWLTTNIATRDGQELTGVVGAEDDQSVTLKLGGDQVQKVAKSNIARRDTLKVSNMPEGLAAGLAPQEFVDLIEYLASLK